MNHNKEFSKEDLSELRYNFRNFLDKNYSNLKRKDVLCSDAFYIFRTNIGIKFNEVLENEYGLEKYRELLFYHFKNKGRKNPNSDSFTYCNALKYLVEFVKKYKFNLNIETTNKYNLDLNLQNKQEVKPYLNKYVDINTPSQKEILKYLNKWDNLINYKAQEDALDKLFLNVYPKNEIMEDILVKVATLNDFYSTNIYNTFNVAKNIFNLNIDERLDSCDVSLVNDIAKIKIEEGNVKNFYSFATKYCSHHKPLDYPIYDSYVEKVLKYFRDEDKFFKFKNEDLKNYKKFKEILIEFKKYYKLNEFNFKDIDRYLWLLGKEKFPKDFKKKRVYK